MVLDKKCAYFIHIHIHTILCSVWWSVRYGHKRGHRRDSGKQTLSHEIGGRYTIPRRATE